MPAERTDPDTSLVLVTGLVGATLLFVLVLLVTTFTAGTGTSMAAPAAPPQEVTQVRAEHEAQLSGYRWVDREGGVVAVPVERAVELILREQGVAPTTPESAVP